MISTVIRNITINTIKFTHQGKEIDIMSECEDGHISIEISDQGVGIEPEVLKNLFNIEHKHKTSGTSGEKGTGLGLIICKEFIEMNGVQSMLKAPLVREFPSL